MGKDLRRAYLRAAKKRSRRERTDKAQIVENDCKIPR